MSKKSSKKYQVYKMLKYEKSIFQPQLWRCITTQSFCCLFLKNCQKASKIYRKSEGLTVTHLFFCFAITFLSISFLFQMRTYPFYHRLRPCKSYYNYPTVDQKYDLNENAIFFYCTGSIQSRNLEQDLEVAKKRHVHMKTS